MPYYTKDPKRDPNFDNHPYSKVYKGYYKGTMIEGPQKTLRVDGFRVF